MMILKTIFIQQQHKQRIAAYFMVFVSLIISPLYADGDTLHFAGFAFSGQSDRTEENFPESANYFHQNGKASLLAYNQALFRAAQGHTPDGIKLSADLGNLHSGDSLAMAVVLTWENVGKEQFPDFTKVSVDLQGELMLFDFNSRQIVATYPFGVEYIDAVRGALSEARMQAILQHLYDPESGSFTKEYLTVLQRISLHNTHAGIRVQLAKPEIDQPAADTLAQYHIPQDKAEHLLINGFERYLSHNGNIPVLPFQKDQVIGGAMALRFANGDVFNLKIPNPDYRIHLTLTNLRKVKISENAARIAWAYASYLHIAIRQSLTKEDLLSADIKYPVLKDIATDAYPDDVSAFETSLLTISDQITRAMQKPDDDWMDKWLVRDDKKSFSDMPAFLDRCR